MRLRRSPLAVMYCVIALTLAPPTLAAPAAPTAPAPAPAAPAPAPAAPATPAAPAARPWELGALRLETDAAGADVWIDEQRVGRAPLPGAWTLAGGTHAVRVALGDWSQAAQVLVTPGQVTTVRLARDAGAAGEGAPVSPAPEEALSARVERVHPGAGVPVRGVGYALLALGVGALGYGVVTHLAATQERQSALLLSDSRAAERERRLEGAMSELWGARLGVGGGAVGALGGLAMLGWSRGGWFVDAARAEGAEGGSE
ncbi:MAG: PEGA domain-containing protein [Deltaproteobacteria bacterium]|nr:PEGA domain-containing protein [Deltaproteobacteria bacterium]